MLPSTASGRRARLIRQLAVISEALGRPREKPRALLNEPRAGTPPRRLAEEAARSVSALAVMADGGQAANSGRGRV